MNDEAIAIIGMALRAPQAETLEEYWHLLLAGRDCLTRGPGLQDSSSGEEDRFVDVCGKLRDIDAFDAAFFEFRPSEAELIDPQQRFFLECAWEALESAGHLQSRDRKRIGVYASAGFSTYLADNVYPTHAHAKDGERLELLLANDRDFFAARVAYKLDLKGPAVMVQAACASSLAAVHFAVQSLLLGECDMALAGGAAIDVSRGDGYYYEPNLIFSSDGNVRSFDRDASGTVPSAGAGVVLLKRLEDAINDGDPIHAVVLGSAMTNDGGARAGMTAPTAEGVARAAREALTVARTRAEEVGYIEAHGSGTRLGDRTEVRGLLATYANARRTAPCWIGSVKSNIGHLDVASGVAGLIKAALIAYHGRIPPSINCRQSLQELEGDAAQLRVVRSEEALVAPEGGVPKVGLNSMGLGGHNVHFILARHVDSPRTRSASSDFELLAWSAREEAAANALGDRIATHLQTHSTQSLHDVAFALAACRPDWSVRRAVVVERNGPDLVAQLRDATRGRSPGLPRLVIGQFPGLGEIPRFDRVAMTGCSELLRVVDDCLAWTEREQGAEFALELSHALSEQPMAGGIFLMSPQPPNPFSLAVRHAALCVWSVAMARQFVAWGLKVDAWCGYSLGEFAAAVMAGIFSLEDALRLVLARAALLASDVSYGSLLAVSEDAEAIAPFLSDDLFVAIDAGPGFCVVGGQAQSLQRFSKDAAARDIAIKPLDGNGAFHTRLATAALPAFQAVLGGVQWNRGTARFDSGLLGLPDAGEQASSAAYWMRHLVECIQYRNLLDNQFLRGPTTLIEFGMGGDLTAIAKRSAGALHAQGQVTALRCADPEGGACEQHMLKGLARLWTHGAEVDWRRYHDAKQQTPRRVWLPTYPFQRQSYWISAPRSTSVGVSRSSTYTIGWEPCISQQRGSRDVDCLRIHMTGKGDLSNSHDIAVWFDLGSNSFIAGQQTIPAAATEELAALLESFSSRHIVLHFDAVDYDKYDFRAAGQLSSALVCVARAAEQLRAKRFVVVANQAFWIDRNDTGRPIGQMLAACTLVLEQECPALSYSFLDLGGDRHSLERVLRLLPDMGGIYAWRKGQLLERTACPLIVSPVAHPLLRNDATYLITGGGGMLGAPIVAHLRETYGARVIVVGRSIEEAAHTGDNAAANSGIVRIAADVCDADSLSRGLARAGIGVTEINGIFHLAGLTMEVATIGELSSSHIDQQLATRCQGMAVLDTLFGSDGPDFKVVFSSTASILGGRGLYGYAASCALADGLAQSRTRAGSAWLSLGWDGWKWAGNNADAFALGEHFFNVDEALELLDSLLVHGQQGHVLCMKGDFVKRLSAAKHGKRSAPSIRTGGDQSSVKAAVKNSLDDLVVGLWTEMMGRPVDPDDEFFELGGDSLLAVRITGAVRKRWGVRLPMTLFMEKATPRRFARALSEQLATQGESAIVSALQNSESERKAAGGARLADLTPVLNAAARLIMARTCCNVEAPEAVLPKHERLFQYFKEIVDDDSRLSSISHERIDSELQALEARLRGMTDEPAYEALISCVIQLGKKMDRIVQGFDSALEILFEGDDQSYASMAYRHMPEAAKVLDCLSELGAAFASRNADRPLRVLEIGGGLGVATEKLIPQLPAGTEYIFSDISISFFPEIRDRFPHITCELLDLDAVDLAGQFQGRGPFDLIVGANALHCAKSVAGALQRLKPLLAPDGALLLMEALYNEPWHLIAMGPLEGYLSCTDFRCAQPGPFLSIPIWRRILSEAQFDMQMDISDIARYEGLGQAAFLATTQENPSRKMG